MRFDFKKISMNCLFALALFASEGYADYYCYDCCEEECSRGYVAYENVIVRPYFTRNNAYFLDSPNNVDGQVAEQFKWDYTYSPRVELGWNGICGVGLRGRYWYFDHDTKIHAEDPNGDIASWFGEDTIDDLGFENSTSALFIHDMNFHVGDLEATFSHCNWIFFAGGRYVNTDQLYRAENLSGSGEITAKHSFKGIGLTTGVDYLHPIRCNFSLYVKGRASLVYGESDWSAFNDDVRISTRNCRDFLPVVELQLGVDWRKQFCNSMIGFIRFGIETQYWANAGAGGPGCNAVYDEGNYQSSNPEDSNLGFAGFNVAVGLLF